MNNLKPDTILFIIALLILLAAIVFADNQDVDIVIKDLDSDSPTSMSPTGAMSGTIG